jgi:hypothetical protein
VHAVKNMNNITSIDPKTNNSMISVVSSIDDGSVTDDNKDKSSTKQDTLPTTSLKHLVFKKMPTNIIEVKVSFSNIEFIYFL